MSADKELAGISLEEVQQKRNADLALNASPIFGVAEWRTADSQSPASGPGVVSA